MGHHFETLNLPVGFIVMNLTDLLKNIHSDNKRRLCTFLMNFNYFLVYFKAFDKKANILSCLFERLMVSRYSLPESN